MTTALRIINVNHVIWCSYYLQGKKTCACISYDSTDIERGTNFAPFHWRNNDHDGVSNHQPHGCLLNRLLRRRSKKTSKLRVTGLCVWKSPGPVNSPHKGPVTRKMFPFDDVIMILRRCLYTSPWHVWYHVIGRTGDARSKAISDAILNKSAIFLQRQT